MKLAALVGEYHSETHEMEPSAVFSTSRPSRLRFALSRLIWKEPSFGRPKRSVDRELQELWPSLD